MADPFGFLTIKRKDNPLRDVLDRINDWQEIQIPLAEEERKDQAARCMDCGIPFCHTGSFFGNQKVASGCPNDNLIPEWNDLIFEGRYQEAFQRLSRTNPLPEMTGRVCPAPCEKGCTEALNGEGVTIHDNERFIIDTAFEHNWVKEDGIAGKSTGFKIAIVGSGPAGLTAAWRLNQLGHAVTIYERSDRFGGLLMYGIPNMKLDKKVVQRRINLMMDLGITFIANTEIGRDLTADDLQAQFDRVILATGASVPRDVNVFGRDLEGIHFAVDYLTEVTKSLFNQKKNGMNTQLVGKHVVVIGGGDTGNDCIGTAIRQGAASVRQLEINPSKPQERLLDNPWPEIPVIQTISYGQQEAAQIFGVNSIVLPATSTTKFLGNPQGKLVGIEVVNVNKYREPIEETRTVLKADIALIAIGFSGPETHLFTEFGIKEIYDDNTTNNERVLVAGDAKRGQSLVIWGIKEGRMAAEKIDQSLRALNDY